MILKTWADYTTSWGFKLIIPLLVCLFINLNKLWIFFTSFPCQNVNLARLPALPILILCLMIIPYYLILPCIEAWWVLCNILLSHGLIYPLLFNKLVSLWPFPLLIIFKLLKESCVIFKGLFIKAWLLPLVLLFSLPIVIQIG